MIPEEIQHDWKALDQPIYIVRKNVSISTAFEGTKTNIERYTYYYECDTCKIKTDRIYHTICTKKDRRKGYRRQEDIDCYE